MKWTSKKKVLVVDQNREGYELDCQLVFIQDTKRALSLIDRTRAAELPNLVMVDMAASGTGGFEFARQFQNRFGHLKIPLVITTQTTYSDDLPEAMSAGADGLIQKPVTKEKVVELLEERKSRMAEQVAKTQTFRVSFS